MLAFEGDTIVVLGLLVLMLAVFIIFQRADITALNVRITDMGKNVDRLNTSLATTKQKLTDADARVAALVAAQADSLPPDQVAATADAVDALGAQADNIAKPAG